jgi:flagellar basal body-associated protein FliL
MPRESAPAEPATAEEQPPPTRSSRKLVLIGGLVIAIAGGATALWLGIVPFAGGGAGEAEATAVDGNPAAASGGGHGGGHADDGHGGGHGKDGHGGGAAPATNGSVLPLDPFIANLADEGGKRYLKTTFQVEFFGSKVPAKVQPRLPQIRDLVLTLLTSKTFDDIRTPDGKQELREEIIARINQTLDNDAVKAVYFTEFIVQ